MTEREEAISHFQWLKKMFCEEWQKTIPKDSVAYMASKKEERYYDMAISALKGGWIPIEEREPDSAKVVFLSLQSFEVVKGWKSKMLLNGKQCYYDCNAEDYIASNSVLAWRPLPEPYKGESEVAT